MNILGIYFGPNMISVIETSGRKLINNIQIPQSTMGSGELEEKVPAEVKTIGIIALLKEELRKNKILAKEASLCLSGKDLIIRTFEIPVLPREELKNAINFEAKKYIPFRVEDLISDFQLKFDKVSRTNLVLFVGIKKETLDRYISISNQLNIKLKNVEYCAFSILRCLKLAGENDSGIIGVLSADLEGRDEVNFSVLENGFPLFSRDITLTEGPEQAVNTGEPEHGKAMEKLQSEIRVSLDYYHRKFPSKNIKKILAILNPNYVQDMETFMTDLGMPIKFLDTGRFMDRSSSYSLSSIKGYSASLRGIKNSIIINLLLAREKLRSVQEKVERGAQKEPMALLAGLRPDSRIVVLCVLIFAAAFGLGYYRIQPLKAQLNDALSLKRVLPGVNPDATFDQLTAKDNEFKQKIGALDKLIKEQLYLTKPLDIIPRIIPKGLKLSALSFRKSEGDKLFFRLEGLATSGDRNSEFEAVNTFVSRLKDNPEFAQHFNNISVDSLETRELEKLTITSFSISCVSN